METRDIHPRLIDVIQGLFDIDAVVSRPDLTAARVAGWDSPITEIVHPCASTTPAQV